MFFKLVTNSDDFGGTQNLNDTSRWKMMRDLYAVITGTITNTSGLDSTVWNVSACTLTGARPTNGIYQTQVTNNTSAAAYNDQYFRFRKYHYGKTINSSYTPYRDFYLRWCNDWGIVPRTTTGGNSANMMPGNSSSDWFGNGNTTSGIYRALGHTLANQFYSFEGIVNDKVFVLRVNRASNLDTWHLHSVMVDQEYQPNLDDYLHGTYNDWCPTVMIHNGDIRLERNDTVGYTNTTNDVKQFQVFKQQVVGQNTDGYNTALSGTSHYHTGYYTTQVAYAHRGSYWPPAWHETAQRIPMSNGDNAYLIQPLMYEGGYGANVRNNQHYDWKQKARMMNMYRTNDDSFYTGERVTDADGNVYRAFRMHKVGGQDNFWGYNTQVSKNAVYLFPEGGT